MRKKESVKEFKHKGALDLNKVKLAIGIPCNYPHVPMQFFESFIEMETIPFMYIRGNQGSIDEMRNAIVYRALEQECTHLLMIDTDMRLPSNMCKELLMMNVDIAVPLFFRRYPPFDPLALHGTINKYKNVTSEELIENTWIDIDASGTGVMLINTDVFKNMKPPWFQFKKNPNKKKGGIVGEDIYFCYKARKLGYRIVLNPSIEVGHLSTLEVNKRLWELNKFIRKSKEVTKESKN